MDTFLFDSDDLDRTEEFLSKAYARMRIGSSTENFRAQVSREVMGSLSMDQFEIGFDMSYAVNPLGKVCLVSLHSGTLHQHYPSMADSFGPGDLFSLAPPELPYAGVVRHARYTLTMFDPALLTQVAATAPTRRPEPLRLLGYRPVSPAAGRHLLRTLAYLRDHVLTEPSVRDAPLVASTALQLLAASVLTAFPNNALTDPTSEDHHDTTPTAYLRRVRLDRAHQDLRAANPADGTTVTTIAARWGFAHPGRFATHYRHAYGQAPSTTLHT